MYIYIIYIYINLTYPHMQTISVLKLPIVSLFMSQALQQHRGPTTCAGLSASNTTSYQSSDWRAAAVSSPACSCKWTQQASPLPGSCSFCGVKWWAQELYFLFSVLKSVCLERTAPLQTPCTLSNKSGETSLQTPEFLPAFFTSVYCPPGSGLVAWLIGGFSNKEAFLAVYNLNLFCSSRETQEGIQNLPSTTNVYSAKCKNTMRCRLAGGKRHQRNTRPWVHFAACTLVLNMWAPWMPLKTPRKTMSSLRTKRHNTGHLIILQSHSQTLSYLFLKEGSTSVHISIDFWLHMLPRISARNQRR